MSDFTILSDGICVTKVTDLTLEQYCYVHRLHCLSYHVHDCLECSYTINAANMILQEGIAPLRVAFETASPGVSYSASKAKQHLLQMPLVTIRLGEPSSGKSQTYVLEYVHGVDYVKIANILGKSLITHSAVPSISKEELKKLLLITRSDRERDCVRYAVFKASGLTPSAARRHFGFERMDRTSNYVEECLHDAELVYQAVKDLSESRERAAILNNLDSSSDYSSSESDNEFESEVLELDSFQIPDVQC